MPAHMPHLISRQVMDKIEKTLTDEVDKTSSHRFRQGDDLQFAFTYYHMLNEFEKEKKQAYYDSLWSLYLDTNHDGILDSNEMRTLAAMVYGDDVNDQYVIIIIIDYYQSSFIIYHHQSSIINHHSFIH